MTEQQDLSAEHQRAFERVWESVYGRAPRHTWFQPPRRQRNGPMFGWTLEPVYIDEADRLTTGPGGLYASMVWWPKGKGSRSNRAELWEIVEELTTTHRTRREARTRALRLYRAHYDHGATLADLKSGRYLQILKVTDEGKKHARNAG